MGRHTHEAVIARPQHNIIMVLTDNQKFHEKRLSVETIDNLNSEQFQQFLDDSQYKLNGILRYEKIFGRGFISTGGLTTTKEVVGKLNLTAGEKVLSVGCGIGGGEIYMKQNFGVSVHGIDLSHNMLSVARLRAQEAGIDSDDVKFEHANVLVRDFPPESFDVIYSRDCIIHIREKKELFERFFRWLKPGGRLMISDYTCCTDEEKTEEFWEYLADRKYDLRPIGEYKNFIEMAGFEVTATDMSKWFIDILNMELNGLDGMKNEFLKCHSEQDYKDIVDGWQIKLVRCRDGTQQWSLFQGKKPET